MAPLGIPRPPPWETRSAHLRPGSAAGTPPPPHLAPSEQERGTIVPTSLCSPASPSPAVLLARPPTSRLTSSLGRAPLTRYGRGRTGRGSEPGAPPAPASGSSSGRTLWRRSEGPWPRPSSGSARRRPCRPSRGPPRHCGRPAPFLGPAGPTHSCGVPAAPPAAAEEGGPRLPSPSRPGKRQFSDR